MQNADEVQQAALARQVSALIAQGRRVEVQSRFDAVLVRGRLIEFRERVLVNEAGETTVEKLPLDRNRLILLIGFGMLVLVWIIYLVVVSIVG